MIRSTILGAALLFSVTAAPAATVLFNTDPFAGSTAPATPGRQVVGGELFLPTFDVTQDQFVFDLAVFGVSQLNFMNDFAANLPTSGVNVIVLRDIDNDNDPATSFNAGTAANLIAAAIDTPGAGFFIYSNQNLGLNRLVFSADLNDNTADLKILARILSPSGQGARDALPTFVEQNFAAVPEPGTAQLMAIAGALLLAGLKLRK